MDASQETLMDESGYSQLNEAEEHVMNLLTCADDNFDLAETLNDLVEAEQEEPDEDVIVEECKSQYDTLLDAPTLASLRKNKVYDYVYKAITSFSHILVLSLCCGSML